MYLLTTFRVAPCPVCIKSFETIQPNIDTHKLWVVCCLPFYLCRYCLLCKGYLVFAYSPNPHLGIDEHCCALQHMLATAVHIHLTPLLATPTSGLGEDVSACLCQGI